MKQLLKKIIPRSLRQAARDALALCRRHSLDRHLARFRRHVWDLPRNSVARCLEYEIGITDGPNFYVQYKDEFVRRIYDFESSRSDPLIIDGGSNTGMSILAFKRTHPHSRIVAFEPDPAIFRLLKQNLERNNVDGVTLIEAGLSGEAGTTTFTPDHTAGGQVVFGGAGISIRVERLSSYLSETVDFLKLNIEGLELSVLEEASASGKLRNVQQLVLEYHGFSDAPQRLGDILKLLDREGFRYLIHDFDDQTCPTSKPPFRLERGTTWFCLVYAKQL